MDRARLPTADLRAPAAAIAGGQSGRIGFLDAAKGIGILLVVLGHCLGGLHSAGLIGARSPGWFCFYLIYSFHMPLFFFLTGSLVRGRVAARPGGFLAADVTRIAYPYLLWGTLQTAIQLAAAGLINHPLGEPPAHLLLAILWAPPAQFWFLYALFFLHLAALATLRAGGLPLFAASGVLLFAAAMVWPAAGGFVTGYASGIDLLFYALGVGCGGIWLSRPGGIARPGIGAALAGAILLVLVRAGWNADAPLDTYAALPAACAGSAAVLLVSQTGAVHDNPFLARLGRRALPIYVLHILCLAGARILLMRGLHLASLGLILPLIFAAGIAGPLAIDRLARRLGLQAALGLR